jgi:hypothetical protein
MYSRSQGERTRGKESRREHLVYQGRSGLRGIDAGREDWLANDDRSDEKASSCGRADVDAWSCSEAEWRRASSTLETGA